MNFIHKWYELIWWIPSMLVFLLILIDSSVFKSGNFSYWTRFEGRFWYFKF